jgi:hypothetical protein
MANAKEASKQTAGNVAASRRGVRIEVICGAPGK